jgi:heterotetrameric sarcosine oxidase gamma subunit
MKARACVADLALTVPGLVLTRADPAAVWLLRLRAPAAALPPALSAIGQDPRILWLGPKEYLFVGGPAPDLVGFGTAHLADMAPATAGYVIAGEGSVDLLAKGSSLDFHPRAFGPDRCARTLFAGVSTIIDRNPEGFQLYIEASYAPYMEDWFADAMIEFQTGQPT